MNENDNDKEISKAKKIRRILLLKTDQELKLNSKKNANIKINSKTIQELNQTYNSYKILLSESTSIYSNYVQIIQRMYPDNSFKEKKEKETPTKKRVEQNNSSLNSSFESHFLSVDFVPNKIDLGKKKISFRKRNTIDSANYKLFEEINEVKETEDILIKSTKLGNKNINKVIDNIVCLKFQDDIEDDDNNIKKNVMKLRKYCYKLIKKKKKPKKQKLALSLKRKQRERGKEGIKLTKRKTTTHPSYFYKNSLLFGNKEKEKEKENNQDAILTRENTVEIKSNHFQSKLSDKEKKHIIRNENIDSQERKNIRLNSLKDLKTIRERSENIDKKNKIRRTQTLNMKDQPLKYQKKESIKKESSLKQVNEIIKGSMVSTKFVRPSKFIIINNNINNANIIVKNDINKKNNLFGLNRVDSRKQKTIKEKTSCLKNHLVRKSKHTVKLFSPEFKKIKSTFNS